MPNRTLVIAEPGGTHEGDKATLLRLIETAAECGCDVIKPQWCSNPVRMCERRHIGQDHPRRSYYERAYGWLSFPLEWHAEFSAQAKALGMQYACTSFLPEDVATVDPYVDIHKIASFENADHLMRGAVCSFSTKPVIVSLGMRTITETRDVIRYWPPSRAKFLHCVSAYPAPLAGMNLGAIRGNQFDVQHGFLPPCDGLSDHSRNLLTGAVAVGAGAEIIETHFRLDDCHPSNPDYAVSFRPVELKTYIDFIRQAEQMMGDGIKRVQPCEEWALPYRVTG